MRKLSSFTSLLALAVCLSARAAQVGLAPWTPTYAPAPVATVTGLQSLLKTDAGQALLAQNQALAFLTRLDPQSEVQRRVVGALGLSKELEALTPEALRDARQSAAAALALADLAGKALPAQVISVIDLRVADVLAAVDQGSIDTAQLEAAARELAPFEGYSRHDGVALVTKMANAAREKGTLDAAKELASKFDLDPEAPKADYGWRAVHLMGQYGRDIGPSLPSLQQFSNERQIDALKVLLEHDYQIANKAPYLLKFNNFEQVFALRHMVEAGRDVMPSLDAITRFDNPYQGEAVKILVQHDYQIADKIDDVVAIKGPLPVEALRYMAAYGRQLQPSMAAIAKIDHQRQTEAIRALLEGSNARITYSIADKIETILRFDNDSQLAALRALVARSLPVRELLTNLERVKTPEHSAMVESLAANAKRPAEETLKQRVASLAVTLGLLVGIVTILNIHHALVGAGLFAGSLLAAWVLRRRAKSQAAALARANRDWLNGHPEIEAALGPVEASSLFASDWNRFLRP